MNIVFIIIIIIIVFMIYKYYNKVTEPPQVIINKEIIVIDEPPPVISYYREYDNVPSFRGMVKHYHNLHNHEIGGSKHYKDYKPSNDNTDHHNVTNIYNKKYESYRKNTLKEKLENVVNRPECNKIYFN